MYITSTEYAAMYGSLDANSFARMEYEARRYIDKYTTGIDGVKKLKTSFPIDENDVGAVKYCAGALINYLSQIQEAEKSASMGRGYTETANGLHGKVITSISSGNESISYSAAGLKTAADIAASDDTAKTAFIRNTIMDYLSGVTDANGVNLLYMGVYPRV